MHRIRLARLHPQTMIKTMGFDVVSSKQTHLTEFSMKFIFTQIAAFEMDLRKQNGSFAKITAHRYVARHRNKVTTSICTQIISNKMPCQLLDVLYDYEQLLVETFHLLKFTSNSSIEMEFNKQHS